MGNFNRGGDRGGDRGGFRNGGGRDFGGRPSFQKKSFGGGDTQMHKTTCAECGKSCEVPFLPKDGRPVYCSDCFGKKGGRDGETRPERREYNNDRPVRSFDKPSFEAPRNDGDTKRRLESIEYKIDKLVRSMDLILSSKMGKDEKTSEKKAPAKDAAQIKEELTAVVKAVSKGVDKEAKATKPAKEAKTATVKKAAPKAKAKGKK